METVWIIGGGRFGKLAVDRLEGKYRLCVVDPVAKNLNQIKNRDIELECRDGVSFLKDNLQPDSPVSWIIPSLPIHLAFEWARTRIGKKALVPAPIDPESMPELPNPMADPLPGRENQIYVSHADFICPDHCSEPDDICTMTKKPRQKPMYDILSSIRYKNFLPIVIKSRQIAPGVGGYRPADLFAMLTKIEHQRGRMLICTACKCHGVITGADAGVHLF